MHSYCALIRTCVVVVLATRDCYDFVYLHRGLEVIFDFLVGSNNTYIRILLLNTYTIAIPTGVAILILPTRRIIFFSLGFSSRAPFNYKTNVIENTIFTTNSNSFATAVRALVLKRIDFNFRQRYRFGF